MGTKQTERNQHLIDPRAWKGAIVGALAIAVASMLVLLHPHDVVGSWQSSSDSRTHVELCLLAGRRFEAEVSWLGAETKPMPHFAMAGVWAAGLHDVVLDVEETKHMGPSGVQPLQVAMPYFAGHLHWKGLAGEDVSLSKFDGAGRRIMVMFDPYRR